MSDYKFVEVKWIDSASTSTWSTLKDLAEPVTILTRGWLVRDEETYVVLAGSRCLKTDHDTEIFGEHITIPRCSFLSKLKVLKERG